MVVRFCAELSSAWTLSKFRLKPQHPASRPLSFQLTTTEFLTNKGLQVFKSRHSQHCGFKRNFRGFMQLQLCRFHLQMGSSLH